MVCLLREGQAPLAALRYEEGRPVSSFLRSGNRNQGRQISRYEDRPVFFRPDPRDRDQAAPRAHQLSWPVSRPWVPAIEASSSLVSSDAPLTSSWSSALLSSTSLDSTPRSAGGLSRSSSLHSKFDGHARAYLHTHPRPSLACLLLPQKPSPLPAQRPRPLVPGSRRRLPAACTQRGGRGHEGARRRAAVQAAG